MYDCAPRQIPDGACFVEDLPIIKKFRANYSMSHSVGVDLYRRRPLQLIAKRYCFDFLYPSLRMKYYRNSRHIKENKTRIWSYGAYLATCLPVLRTKYSQRFYDWSVICCKRRLHDNKNNIDESIKAKTAVPTVMVSSPCGTIYLSNQRVFEPSGLGSVVSKKIVEIGIEKIDSITLSHSGFVLEVNSDIHRFLVLAPRECFHDCRYYTNPTKESTSISPNQMFSMSKSWYKEMFLSFCALDIPAREALSSRKTVSK